MQCLKWCSLILALVAMAWAAIQEITAHVYAPARSDLYKADVRYDRQAVKSAYLFLTPAAAAKLALNTSFKMKKAEETQSQYSGGPEVMREYFVEVTLRASPENMAGYYLVRCGYGSQGMMDWENAKEEKVHCISVFENLGNGAIGLLDDEGRDIEAKLRARTPFQIQGWSFNGDPSNIAMRQFLTKVKDATAGMSVKAVFYAKKGQEEAVWALMCYGSSRLCHAVYGVWNDEKKAQVYGMHAGDQVFISKAEIVPDDNWALPEYQLTKELRYGKECWSLADVQAALQNRDLKRALYERLAWAPFVLNSTMRSRVQFNDDGTEKPYSDGYYIPIPPDEEDNSNPVGLNEFPDGYWYWKLFAQALANESNEARVINAQRFATVGSWMSVMDDINKPDVSIYGQAGEILEKEVNENHIPKAPLIYTRECTPINDDEFIGIYDPFSSQTRFHLLHRDWEYFDEGHIRRADLQGVDVTDKVRTGLNAVARFFNTDLASAQRGNGVQFALNSKNISESLKMRMVAFNRNATVSLLNMVPDRRHLGFFLEEYGKVFYALTANASLLTIPGAARQGYTVKPEEVANVLQGRNWFIMNPFDDYGQYKSAKDFVCYDLTNFTKGKPYGVNSIMEGNDFWESAGNSLLFIQDRQEDKKWWYMEFYYPIGSVDQYGIKSVIGEMHVYVPLLSETDWLVNANAYGECNRNLRQTGVNEWIPSYAQYRMHSKEYNADQKDVADRAAEGIDKGEAALEIAKRIAVAEGVNFLVRQLHTLAKNDAKALPAYQAVKSVQHSRAVKWTAKTVRVVCEAYKTWREIVDEARQVRDTYRNIKKAWTGLRESTTAMWDYYKELDWSTIKFTNATALLPSSVLVRMDVSLANMQYATGDYLGAIEKLALSEEELQDRFHYREKVPGLQNAYQILCVASSMIMIGTTQAVGSAINESAKYMGGGNVVGMRNPDDMSRLSSLARSGRKWVDNADIRQSYANLYVAASWLQFVQGDARDWVTYTEEVRRMTSGGASLDNACSQAIGKGNFAPLIDYFRAPHVFERSMPPL